jgi:hypothetical protein
MSIALRTAMTAMTVSNSMSVNPFELERESLEREFIRGIFKQFVIKTTRLLKLSSTAISHLVYSNLFQTGR